MTRELTPKQVCDLIEQDKAGNAMTFTAPFADVKGGN